MKIRHWKFFSVLIAGILLGVWSLSAVTEKEIYGVLEELDIPFNTNAVQQSAVGGILKAIDPRAKILSPEDALQLSSGSTIEKVEEWGGGICYLKLNGLYKGGGAKVAYHLQMWVEAGHSGLIIDMRGGGGGSLSSVDEIASMFVPVDTVLYRIKDGHDQIVETHQTKEDPTLLGRVPLMLLINKETRNASEVLAAVLKGKREIMLVGSHTRGDSRYREIIPLSDTEMLYIATKRIVPFDGPEYDSVGVEPDIVISAVNNSSFARMPIEEKMESKPLSDKARVDKELMQKVAGDTVLGCAIDILLGLKALGMPEAIEEAKEARASETATNTTSSIR